MDSQCHSLQKLILYGMNSSRDNFVCELKGALAPMVVPAWDLTNKFQPSSGPKAGCYSWMARKSFGAVVFQSSPGPKAGCYATKPTSPPVSSSFNPHPARKPDATQIKVQAERREKVSILTRPESR